MKYYTLQDVLALNPCHGEEQLVTYMAGRKKISLSGILNSTASDIDKVWLMVRLMPTKQVVEFAKWCADSVEHLNSRDAVSAAWVADAAARVADAAAVYAYAASVYAARVADAAARVADAAVYAASVYAHAASAYADACKNQVNQLKLIVKGCGL